MNVHQVWIIERLGSLEETKETGGAADKLEGITSRLNDFAMEDAVLFFRRRKPTCNRTSEKNRNTQETSSHWQDWLHTL